MLSDLAQRAADDVLASPQQLIAHVAMLLAVAMVMAGALMRTMMPLRWLAVCSNVGLMAFGVLHPSLSTLAVAVVLLPINVYRAVEITRLTRRVSRAELAADQAGLWLKPYMKARKLKAGHILFKKDDKAEHLYLLAHGQMELLEIGKPVEPGSILGEIALFSPGGLHTMTASCISACTVLQIHESTVKQLYYQNPSFGFHLIHLLAGRLGADIVRAEARARSDTAKSATP
ncbi:MAG: cyclic nucleotide-binding domain-containing protein [Comamonadaceae bacterium]